MRTLIHINAPADLDSIGYKHFHKGEDASSRPLGRQRVSFPDLAHRESVDIEDD